MYKQFSPMKNAVFYLIRDGENVASIRNVFSGDAFLLQMTFLLVFLRIRLVFFGRVTRFSFQKIQSNAAVSSCNWRINKHISWFVVLILKSDVCRTRRINSQGFSHPGGCSWGFVTETHTKRKRSRRTLNTVCWPGFTWMD